MGANNASAQSLLKQDYNEDCNLEEACGMAVKVLSKTMDSTKLSSEKSTSSLTVLRRSGEELTCGYSRVRNRGTNQGRQDIPQTLECG
jgi:20S proteasome alpha/beta subunit